ncbi:hypothetical protein [Aquincola tertiaricarbonis]|uniref:hypothetical protein n=1 Tax=Aquincola tertiaricarbonis TaxID=391953 RepID=UPI0012EE9FC4|nr:hypothetical protein [Aquincola tertiaricarbonis]
MTPQPQTIASALNEQLTALLHEQGHYFDESDPRFAEFMDEAEKLARVDVIMASKIKALLYGLTGNRDKATYWITNARRNGGRIEALGASAASCQTSVSCTRLPSRSGNSWRIFGPSLDRSGLG